MSYGGASWGDAEEATVAGAVAGYQLIEKLGAGTSGEVFRAMRIADRKQVALKLLSEAMAEDPISVRRLRREAQLAQRVGHPNLIDVLELGQCNDGRPFVVMDLAEGQTLAQILVDHGPMDEARALWIIYQMALGVGALHQVGIIHRDLKPSNVLVGLDDSVCIIDFGLALDIGPEAESRLTRAGFAVGTPLYLAPEQAEGAVITPAVDVYALGVVLYELLAGKTPFIGSVGEVLAQKRSVHPELSGRSKQVNQWIQAFMHQQAKERPQSGAEVATLLEALVELPQRRPPTGGHENTTVAAGAEEASIWLEGFGEASSPGQAPARLDSDLRASVAEAEDSLPLVVGRAPTPAPGAEGWNEDCEELLEQILDEDFAFRASQAQFPLKPKNLLAPEAAVFYFALSLFFGASVAQVLW